MKKRRWGAVVLWLIAGVIVIGLVGGTAFALAWQGQYSGKVYPGRVGARCRPGRQNTGRG